MEKFALGLVLGSLCGAIFTANNCKMRALVKKGQDEFKSKLDEMMDEKLKEMDCNDGNCCCGQNFDDVDKTETEKPKTSSKRENVK